MDLTFVTSRLTNEIGDPQRTAGPGPSAAQLEESFADHLQVEPRPDAPAAPPETTQSRDSAEEAVESPPDDQAHDSESRDEQVDSQDQVVPIAAEPSEPPAAEPTADTLDTQPAASPDAEISGTPSSQPVTAPGPSAGQDAAAEASQGGPGRLSADTPGQAATGAPQLAPAHQPTTASGAAPQAPASASPQSIADQTVVVDAAVTPEAASAAAATAPTSTAAAEKSPGKQKSERSSSAARSASASQLAAGVSIATAAPMDPAAQTATHAELTRRLTDRASARSSIAGQDPDRTAATDVGAGKANTPTSDRATPITERFSEHMFARSSSSSSTQANAPHELTHADQLRLIQRVARAMEAAPQRGGLLRLRLRPPELGSLRLDVSLQDGSLSARIETETQAAKTLLLDQLPQLRDRLAEHGFRVERFDVDVAEQHSSDTPGQSHDAHDAQPAGPARRHTADASDAIQESIPVDHVPMHAQPGTLNVVI